MVTRLPSRLLLVAGALLALYAAADPQNGLGYYRELAGALVALALALLIG